jgi:RNA polymerase sigma-70 factor (ECF subfamily)
MNEQPDWFPGFRFFWFAFFPRPGTIRAVPVGPRVPLTGTLVTAQDSYICDSGGGEDLVFERLVDACYGPLYRFALSLTRSETEAGDLVQETFHIWAVKGHQLRDARKARSWLFTTLHRLFLEGQRKLARFPQVELEDAREELPGVDPESVDRLDAGALMELLARVDPQFQAPVALFYLEDCPYQEIAKILDIPLGTVKSRIARGLAQMRQLLAKEMRADGGSHEGTP